MSRSLVGTLAFLASSALLGQLADPPLTNWTVPPYTQSSVGGLTTMTDATPPRVFIGVQPCRLVDTRAGSGFPAGFGAPSLVAGVPRNFDLDSGPCPGLPSGIDAYSLNVTVTNTAGPGHLVIYPQGAAQPTVSSINYVGGQTIANAVVVAAGTESAVTVLAGVSGTDLLIDVNGYFSETAGDLANTLSLNTNSLSATAAFKNLSTNCVGACGVYAEISSPGVAVGGFASSDSGPAVGVAGEANALSANSSGVVGLGVNPPFNPTSYAPTGVRGESDVIGVLGVSAHNGVMGELIREGTAKARGILGFENEDVFYGVYSALGSAAATGALYTVDPHPTQASKVIRYASLEGPEAGTYFRGRGRFERGIARITVPEDFRMVTDSEGLSVQITPIGAMATVAVMKVDLNEIVVQSSRNVEFFYLVNGIRLTHKHLISPIGEGDEYRPESAQARMPKAFTEEQKRLLVQNGTYNEDGTVNRETARRLGWDRKWAERERPVPAPTPQ